MPTKRLVIALAMAVTAVSVVACGDDDDSPSGDSGRSKSSTAQPKVSVSKTVGPNGERPVDVSSLSLGAEDVEKLKAGGYKAALAWAATSPFIEALQQGAEDEFERLGIEVTSTSQANFDASKQASQLKTAMAADPDVMLTNPVDPTTAAAAYREAKNAGTKMVFLSNVPVGYKPGADYVGIVTDDLFDMGKRAADSLAEAIGGEGKIGIVKFDVPFYVVNQRDGAFETTIREDHPGIEIAATEGFQDPTKVGDVARAMLAQNRDLDGIYASWSGPGAQVLAAMRAANNNTTKLVTIDLEDTVVVNMVSQGQVAAVIADKAYEMGKGMADTAAYALLGRQAPEFSIGAALTVTKDNVEEGYRDALRTAPPEVVLDAQK